MRELKAIAVLLDYPGPAIQEHAGELAEVFHACEQLTPETRRALADFLSRRQRDDLFDLQAEYVGLFDRSRSLSLHLFEHVHGESRDRGQAMVDLQNLYFEQGLEPVARELPDYVPLFLEFCSCLPEAQIQGWLEELAHLLRLLHARLAERESDYQWLFRAVLEIGGLETADEQLRGKLREQRRDDTPEALDEAWAEEPVVFGPSAGCGGPRTDQGQPVTVQWSSAGRGSV